MSEAERSELAGAASVPEGSATGIPAPSERDKASIAINGTDHAHVVELTQQLVAAGAHVATIVATEEKIGPWLASQYPDARADDPYADDIDIVVTAAIPGERAAIVIDATRANKAVVSDKPGVTSLAQLEQLHAEPHLRWLVVFAERMSNPAMQEAERLVRDGAIGEVLHTVGLGPHTLNLKHRPEWFFDPARYGGILVDIGSHQVDQLLAFTGATTAEVLAATTRSHPDHAGLQVLGEMLLQTNNNRTGYARVDYFTPKGLGSWGDVRFTAVGTHGYIEVRSAEHHVTLVDNEQRRDIDCRDTPVTWARAFINGEMPVTQEHVFAVHDVCLRAQAAARQA